ncbi:TetR/AcrR family transcriptional regulator [Umezawaea endophytica]|uniref:TetR/AcrR family transcriptional regulator n=1 Tax=Umezawaea endophytica TaxID=1654476 RepID=A0A9X2VIP5_9PSEU|nr:TetR/AcrR family transcriptional regulator [Umezawaea endophytica]MCS7476797.1 TetR/AcrR family transcriptional regulator [Umezawaea endophytica]
MPKVSQDHLDARRQQIVDAARSRFSSHGFARTSIPDLVEASGLSVGAIYRYFKSKDQIIVAICEQATQTFPAELTAESTHDFLQHVRTMAREEDHARLVAQIYAEAAVSPSLAALVRDQLDELRTAVAALLPDREPADAERVAEAFVAICNGYTQQLAVRGDLDHAPFAEALMAVVESGRAPDHAPSPPSVRR